MRTRKVAKAKPSRGAALGPAILRCFLIVIEQFLVILVLILLLDFKTSCFLFVCIMFTKVQLLLAAVMV